MKSPPHARLSARDRAFLTDVTQTNWMQHFVATDALVKVGHKPEETASSIAGRHNTDENIAFFSRQPLAETGDLPAQVQAMVALRIVHEYVSGMETTGALLRAIRERAQGSILRLNHNYCGEDIRAFYRDILAGRRKGVARLLNWPTLAVLNRRASVQLATRARRTFPWFKARLVELAGLYVRGRPFRIVNFGARRRRTDPRDYVYIFVDVLERNEQPPASKSSLIVRALNKLKHGFNATASFGTYSALRGARRGIVALEVPKGWFAINQMGQQVDLLGVVAREAARFTLDFDRAGLN